MTSGEEKEGVIYGIRFRRTEVIFYVGQTRQKLETRWRQHLKGRTPLSEGLRALGGAKYCEIVVLEKLSESELNDREVFWINKLRTRDPHGLNQMAGGSARFHSKRTRAKLAAIKKIQCSTPEYRAKVSAVGKRLWADSEYRNKTVEAIKASHSTPEHRKKISKLKKAMWAEESRRRKMSKATKAQWADEKQRAKKTEGIREGCRNPARSAKMSADKKALWADPEWRARQIERVREGWRRRSELRAAAV